MPAKGGIYGRPRLFFEEKGKHAMEFWTTLIKTAEVQSENARVSLMENCIYVDNNVWIFEGDVEALDYDRVNFEILSEGMVPSLGDMDTKELVELCKNNFGVDVYEEKRDK